MPGVDRAWSAATASRFSPPTVQVAPGSRWRPRRQWRTHADDRVLNDPANPASVAETRLSPARLTSVGWRATPTPTLERSKLSISLHAKRVCPSSASLPPKRRGPLPNSHRGGAMGTARGHARPNVSRRDRLLSKRRRPPLLELGAGSSSPTVQVVVAKCGFFAKAPRAASKPDRRRPEMKRIATSVRIGPRRAVSRVAHGRGLRPAEPAAMFLNPPSLLRLKRRLRSRTRGT